MIISARVKTQSPNVSVYKDDGVWWAEMDDPNSGTRFTSSADARGFIDKVESMAEYLDVYADMIVWVPKDDAAKRFLNRARKMQQDSTESTEDNMTPTGEESADATESTPARGEASTPIESS
jgi:hypothetical protein